MLKSFFQILRQKKISIAKHNMLLLGIFIWKFLSTFFYIYFWFRFIYTYKKYKSDKKINKKRFLPQSFWKHDLIKVIVIVKYLIGIINIRGGFGSDQVLIWVIGQYSTKFQTSSFTHCCYSLIQILQYRIKQQIVTQNDDMMSSWISHWIYPDQEFTLAKDCQSAIFESTFCHILSNLYISLNYLMTFKFL